MWIMITYYGLMFLSHSHLFLSTVSFLSNRESFNKWILFDWHWFVLGLILRRGCAHGVPQDQSSDCGVLRHRLAEQTLTYIWIRRDSSVCFSQTSSFIQHYFWTVCVCVCVALCECVYCMNERRPLLFSHSFDNVPVFSWLSVWKFTSRTIDTCGLYPSVYLHIKPWVNHEPWKPDGSRAWSDCIFKVSVS